MIIAAGVLFFAAEKKITEVDKLQMEVEQQAENIEKLAILSSTLPQLTGEMNKFLETLPATEGDVAEFATSVEGIARGLGLTIAYRFDDFPKKVDVAGQNIYGLGSEISLEGSFQGLINFLSGLSNFPNFFKIDKITLLKHETKPGLKITINGFLIMNVEKL